MAGEPYVAIAGNTNRGCGEPAHRDAGLVERRDAGQNRRPKRGGGWRRERAASKQGGERRALVRLDRNPDAVRIGAPRENWGEGRMAMLRKALQAGNRRGCLCGRNRDLVDHRGLAVLEHDFPPRACARRDELDQLRFRFTLRHYGCMVPLRTVAYVIVQPCVGVKDASCVEVCPVDCIHTDDAATMYYIDPDECIDCGACVDPCPVDAIFPEDEVPEQWRDFIKINADYFKNR
jgi:NAD-dependent dihydropyrimidine dehydrogenase PreA subunit